MVEVIALLLLRATFLHLFPIHYAERHDTPAGFALTETVPQASYDSQIVVTNILWDLRRNPHNYLAAADIPSSSWPAARLLIQRESGWNPLARNASGATGLCQALPASKMASAGADYLTNPITQLTWCDSYVKARYGTWQAALQFNLNNGWF